MFTLRDRPTLPFVFVYLDTNYFGTHLLMYAITGFFIFITYLFVLQDTTYTPTYAELTDEETSKLV